MHAKHIVWDWNGTLLDDNHAVVESVNVVCDFYGRERVTLSEWRQTYFRPIPDCYERLLGRAIDRLEEWPRLVQLYYEAYKLRLPTCRLSLDAPEALVQWAQHGGTQSVLSMWPHDELGPCLRERDIEVHFTRIDGLRGEDTGQSKAESFAEHLKAQGLAPDDVVLIGDIRDDAEAAAAVGARSILLTTGIATRAGLEMAGVPVVDSMSEAVALLVAAAAKS
ncbi:HAD hydrolase-like protein [Pendulispora rubella]|uniref:phosphoglycolate phosphatase n=1 Tax=Pendulispora rubella TaxID=2741070 RepID=A0ABZ2L0D3_9BACT